MAAVYSAERVDGEEEAPSRRRAGDGRARDPAALRTGRGRTCCSRVSGGTSLHVQMGEEGDGAPRGSGWGKSHDNKGLSANRGQFKRCEKEEELVEGESCHSHPSSRFLTLLQRPMLPAPGLPRVGPDLEDCGFAKTAECSSTRAARPLFLLLSSSNTKQEEGQMRLGWLIFP